MSERLHKLLAQHGLGSRRQVESWIREGRVLVNGRPAVIGQALNTGDRVVLDGRDVTRLLAVERNLQVIAYHKPTGEMLRRRAGDEREGVEMHLPALHAGRWVAINALGFGEDGLLMLASEGPFALAIARRGHELGVEYRVRALRPGPEAEWPELPREVDLARETVTFSVVEPAGGSESNMWFRVAAGSNGASRRDPRAVRRGRAQGQSRDAREMGTDRAATRPATRPQPRRWPGRISTPLRAGWAWSRANRPRKNPRARRSARRPTGVASPLLLRVEPATADVAAVGPKQVQRTAPRPIPAR